MIKKVPGGYATIHCHGAKKGKRIATFKTKAAALSQHRAIMASKKSRGRS